MALLDSTRNTWIDIDAFELGGGTEHFFKVSSVNTKGVESEFSTITSATVQLVAPGANAIRHGDFSSSEGWALNVLGDAKATSTINENGYYEINISDGSNEIRQVNVQQNNLLVMQGKVYVFEFDAYASSPRAIGAKIESLHDGRINYGAIDNTALSTRVKHFRYEFPMTYPTDTKARVIFECGAMEGNVFIDNVSLTYGTVNSADNQWDNPADFDLSPAYPNPFNPQTTIRYAVPEETDVSIVVYDVQGRHVRTVVEKNRTAGSHEILWDGKNDNGEHVASGLYFYRMTAGDFSKTGKMTLLK
jgi:hypothetical protein